MNVLTENLATIITTLGVALVGWLTYKGVHFTGKAAREANRDTVTATEQATAVHALESMTLNLLAPYREEVTLLRGELARERNDRQEKERLVLLDAERKAVEIQEQITAQTERIDLLTIEVKHWKSMAKAIARWATTLRDQVISLGGSVPTIPDEILMAQLLDERDERPPRAITTTTTTTVSPEEPG